MIKFVDLDKLDIEKYYNKYNNEFNRDILYILKNYSYKLIYKRKYDKVMNELTIINIKKRIDNNITKLFNNINNNIKNNNFKKQLNNLKEDNENKDLMQLKKIK